MTEEENEGWSDEDEAPQAEQPEADTPDQAEDQADAEAVESTGNTDVDEILSGLSRLDGLEVHEHVAEFEGAHQALRRALDAGGQ